MKVSKYFILYIVAGIYFFSFSLNARKPLAHLITDGGYRGSITILDEKQKKWIYSDRVDARKETLPASTFKIPNSLILLEEKRIWPGKVIPWDGKVKRFRGEIISRWNADTDLKNAFQNSTIWFYVKLAAGLDRSRYRRYLQAFRYGNGQVDEKLADFWNQGRLAISPENQVNFLADLKNNRLPLSRGNIEYVKKIMILDQTDAYTLRGKTGWATSDGEEIGWFVGYLETGENVYYFATRIRVSTQKVTASFAQDRKRITIEAFKELHFME